MWIRYVSEDVMPTGQPWAIIEDARGVTILAIDSFAERVARAVLATRSREAALPGA